MTPGKRRPATPASQGPTRTAPDVPAVADPSPDAPVPDELVTAPVPPAATEDGTELLGPDGEPIADEASTGDAGVDWTPPPETGQVDAAHRTTTPSPSPERPFDLYPLPVWPD